MTTLLVIENLVPIEQGCSAGLQLGNYVPTKEVSNAWQMVEVEIQALAQFPEI